MKKLALAFPIISGMLWGLTGVFVRYLTANGLTNTGIVFSRAVIAVVIMFFFIMLTDREKLKVKIKDLWLFIGTGVLGMMGLNVCYNVAINHLSLSLAAVLLAMSPVFVIFLAAIFFKEKITGLKIFCMLMAVLGCVLVSGVLEDLGSITLSAKGVLLGISAAIFYALYSVISRVAMDRGNHTYTIILYSLVFCALFMLPFVDFTGILSYLSLAPLQNAFLLILHSLCASILPYIFFTAALKYVETGKVSILAAGSEPSAAAIFGILFFGEIPSLLSILGLVITIAALAVLCLKNTDK